MQSVPHAVSLGLEITLIVLVWYNFDRYIFYDFQTVCFETYALYRIVGEQTHFVYTEMAEHLCTATIVALVWLETEMGIGVNGIVAFFLVPCRLQSCSSDRCRVLPAACRQQLPFLPRLSSA